MADTPFYSPAVRWRMGEYQAIFRLPEPAKARLRPLIIVPSMEYDFETGEPECSFHDHATKFVKRYTAKWKSRPAWIDVDASLYPEKIGKKSFMKFLFEGLIANKGNVIPVISPDYDVPVIGDLTEAASFSGQGICVRLRLENLMHPQASGKLQKMLNAAGVATGDTDLLIDLGNPIYEPYNVFAKGLLAALTKITDLDKFRSFTILGTAFPESMAGQIPNGAIVRHDWLFYKAFVKSLPSGFRRPAFGDYTTVNPAFKADFDMRKIKPAGKVVYTTSDAWLVEKGGAFRDNPKQMHGHCKRIVESGKFQGPGYSGGDDYISRCANQEAGAGPSNLSKWKEVGISHHIMQTLEDVSKFDGL